MSDGTSGCLGVEVGAGDGAAVVAGEDVGALAQLKKRIRGSRRLNRIKPGGRC